MKRKLWHSALTAEEKKHLKEDAGCNLVSKDAFIRTRNVQIRDNIDCPQCRRIAKKIGLE